ncbi:unnamed protein product [Closterium sp. NIES-53]
MVGALGDAGVVDTLKERLEDVRRCHEANEYGPNLPLAVIEAGIRSVWAEEHPARPGSPRLVNIDGGIDTGVNAGDDQVGSNAGGTSWQRGVIHADEVGGHQRLQAPHKATISVTPLLVGRPDILTWKEAIEPQLEMAELIGFARGTVATAEEHYPDLRVEFRAVQLLTFTVILRCCSLGMQVALKSCREYLDASHQAWHFIESTYQVTDALYIGQLEEPLSYIRMGEEETATDYCSRARRILATMRMASVHYSTVSYLTHQGGRPGQRRQSGGGGSSSWKPTKDADKKNSAKDSGPGGGSRRRECWLCSDPDHLSFECPDRSDSDDDNAKKGRGRSGSRPPRRGRNQPRKEKQLTKSWTLAKDTGSSAGGKWRDDKEASCSLVCVVEPTVLLAPEASEDFQAMAVAVRANTAVVLLDSSCSHHLMGTKEVFADLQLSGDVKHVRGFNGALQDVQGRSTIALQGEAGRQVLIPDVLYVPGERANLLSAGQLKENGVKLQEDGNRMLLVSVGHPTPGESSTPTCVPAQQSQQRPRWR